MKKIIWITSYPKSGNTWVRHFLANYFYNKLKIESDLKILNHIQNFPTYNILKKKIKESVIKKNAYYISKYWIPVQKEITHTNKDFVFIKNHNALITINNNSLTDETFSLGFIYLVRDPRDVAVSYSNFDKTLDLDSAINRITSNTLFCHVSKKYPLNIEILGSWKFNYLSWKKGIPNVPQIIIKYEDLLNNTFKTKLKIINFLSKFCNFDVDIEHLNFSIEQSNFSRLKNIESKNKFNESPGVFFNSGKEGQWKQVLTSEQQEKIENFCRNEMEELGYL